MPKSEMKYKSSWECDFKFLKPGPSEHEAHCTDCNYTFSIKYGGRCDIKRHIQMKRHVKSVENSSDHVVCAQVENDENNNEVELTVLTPEDKVMKAETIQALKVVSSNYSFASTSDDGE